MTDTPASPPSDITPVTIEEEMKRSYLDYAMSVIVSRALPDVRDGLKPVHRRILFAMREAGNDWNRGYRKSARTVGDVMGKYHPHGDTAIYDALVRMAQGFSMRLPLIDGQGNFGSMDGDPPAAMRYTEARLARAATALLDDIDKDTVEFQPNYDDTGREPTVLPARFPNLLVNGAGGIAVGMATNIPTHNLGEVIAACIAYIDDPEITIDELMRLVPGPDFPTGGIIMGRAGIREAYHTGRGSIAMRGRATIEQIRKDREAIVITEIPYQVNKARMVERIAETVREKIIEGISDLRDESDRDGVRVVVELKREAMAEVVLNQLYRYTPLQTSFGINTLALNGGKPMVMNLKDIIAAFIAFREQVIVRRTSFELGKTRERAHVLVGLAIAVANIDAVIALIRAAPDPNVAREQLMARAWPAGDVEPLVRLIDEPGRSVAEDGTYRLSEAQARAILELRLQRLTGLERERIAEELQELARRIVDLLDILESRRRRLQIMRTELTEIRDEFADPRRTTLEELEFEHDVEGLIQQEDMVVTVTHGGYIKRVPLVAYRAQRRGGKGRAGMAIREEDFVNQLFVADTHRPLLFFSTRGMVYKTKVYRLPQGTPQARGKALVNLLPLQEGEKISTVLPLPADEASWAATDVMFATASGYVRRNKLSDFINVNANGKIAMKLEEGDRLIGVSTCTDANDVLLAARGGRCIRFAVGDVRVFSSRTSSGVLGIRLAEGDEVISLSVLHHMDADTAEREAYLRAAGALRRNGEEEVDADAAETAEPPARFEELRANEEFILTVTANGYGKRSSAYEYRITGRGGQGIANIERSERNGDVVASFPVADADQIMLVTDGGQLIRCPVHDIRIAGRKTLGVVLLKVAGGERVVSVAHLAEEEQEREGETS
ncbi:MAG: gyrase subunit [Rhodospirillaceae bacterium]|nr:gyrase subunit [Rhodospirillaceae bacterium]